MKRMRAACCFLCLCLFAPAAATSAADVAETQSSVSVRSGAVSHNVHLETALMAEDMRDHQPVNPAVVFPVSAGKVFCYTVFSSVQEKISIYHAWYYRDKLITKRKLALEPPQWKTYSSIQLREDDRGPWRVEILDQNNTVLKTLRFSITE